MKWEVDIEIIKEAAELGGKQVKKYFGEVFTVKEKSTTADFLTTADTESEKVILEHLSKHFPNFNVFSEEAGLIDKNSTTSFIVDPLDGTNNFVLGLPDFAVSIALVDGKELLAGVIHQPILNKTFFAQRGKGSFLNSTKLKVNNVSDFKKSTISYLTWYDKEIKHENQVITSLNNKEPKRILRDWAPAYDFCLLADGKIEAIINDGLKEHDFLAGKLIIEEAGAKITDFQGKPLQDTKGRYFVASNGSGIHEQLLEVVNN